MQRLSGSDVLLQLSAQTQNTGLVPESWDEARICLSGEGGECLADSVCIAWRQPADPATSTEVGWWQEGNSVDPHEGKLSSAPLHASPRGECPVGVRACSRRW